MPSHLIQQTFNLPNQSFVVAVFTQWKVITAFTNASVGDILVKISWQSMFPQNEGAGAVVDAYLDNYLNISTLQTLKTSDVPIANLEFVGGGGGSSGSTDVVTAVNKVSSSLSTLNTTTNSLVSNVSNNLSSIINLNTLNNAGLSTISSGINATNVAVGLVSSSLTIGNTQRTAGNATLSSISSGIAQLNAVDATANIYLSGISGALNTLNNNFTNKTLTTVAVASGTNNTTLTNARYVQVSSFSLLNALLGGGILINDVLHPVGTYKFYNVSSIKIGGQNANVALGYTLTT